MTIRCWRLLPRKITPPRMIEFSCLDRLRPSVRFWIISGARPHSSNKPHCRLVFKIGFCSMGLFSRKEPEAGSGRRTASRSSLSSEAQATELRGRARRRLIGALALVLAAVIVVPMLFDSPDPTQQASAPVVVPAIVPPEPSQNLAMAPATPAGSTTGDDASNGTPHPATEAPPTDAANGQASAPTPEAGEPSTAVAPTETPAPPVEDPKPEPTPPAKPADKPEAKTEAKAEAPAKSRTDDGSVAIALLEGRLPPQTATATESKGSYILQIAAYGTASDAESRRDRLVGAGVTNAYVQEAVSGGKPTYRLRVGPFPTRDAAQAAQARLRALGYDNGFISTK